MKKLFTVGSLIILSIAFVQNQAIAQTEEGEFKLGAGLAFGSGIGIADDFDNDLGLRVDGYYSITPQIRAGGDFTFYFPKSDDEEFMGETWSTSYTVWELNLNGHYIFLDDEDLILYGLGGLNITGINWSSDIAGESDSDGDTEMGLNLGGGVEYGLDFGDLFGELKLGNLGGDADQFVIGAGVRFNL